MRKIASSLLFVFLASFLRGDEYRPLVSIEGLNQSEIIAFFSDWESQFPDDRIYQIKREPPFVLGTGDRGAILVRYNCKKINRGPLINTVVALERKVESLSDYEKGQMVILSEPETLRLIRFKPVTSFAWMYEPVAPEDLEFITKAFEADHPIEWNQREITAPAVTGYVDRILKIEKDKFRMDLGAPFEQYYLDLERRKGSLPVFKLVTRRVY